MTAVDLDALDAARAAATPGPWEQYDTDDGMCWEDPADAALIVAAVNALPELLADARELRALREAVEGLIAFYEGSLTATQLRATLSAALTSEGERE